MAYQTLSLAYNAFDPLRSEIGASAGGFKTEDDFLRGVAAFIQEIIDDPEDYLDFWDMLEEVGVANFVENLQGVRAHIAATMKTPIKQRGKPPFEK